MTETLVAVDDEAKAVEAAEAQKQRGNQHIKNKEYEKAIAAYTEAIKLQPKNPTFYLNRSIALRSLEIWGHAEKDANMAFELQPTNVKAVFGRVTCLHKLRRFSEAIRAADVGLLLQAENKALQQLRNECVVAKARDAKNPPRPTKTFATRVPTVVKPGGRRRSASDSSSSSSSDSGCDMGPSGPVGKQTEPRELLENELPCAELIKHAGLGEKEEVQRLLDSGTVLDVNWRRPVDGNTALHIAAEEGHEDVIRTLVAGGADPEFMNNFGLRPVCLAEKGRKAYRVLHRMTSALGEVRRNALQHDLP